MGEQKILYAIAESCPFDALLVRQMKASVNSLLQLNVKRFRVPEKITTRYSALDVMKQALELLFEFAPSERNYREAMRTIQVYSEGDEEMLQTLRASFSLIANAVYNAFSGQRQAELLAPGTLFLQGIPFELSELQQAFRFVGVRPPDMTPQSVRNLVFLDEGFEAYKELFEGKILLQKAQVGREENWADVIERAMEKQKDGKALIRAGAEHFQENRPLAERITALFRLPATGRLAAILGKKDISVEVVHRVSDINVVYGKK